MFRIIFVTSCVVISNFSYAESITLECNWSVYSSFETTGQIYGHNKLSNAVPGSFASIRKQLLHMTPAKCASFSKPDNVSLEDYQGSADGYLKPDQINLSCPKGYSPVSEPTWNNIHSSERLNGSVRYYLDSYSAKLVCLK